MSSSSCNVRKSSKACLKGCVSLLDSSAGDSATTSATAVFRRNFAASTVSSLLSDSWFTDHEALPSLEDSLASFKRTYPLYEETSQSDEIRAADYGHLGSRGGHVFLDYVGHGLFSYSQKFSLNQAFLEVSHRSVKLRSWISHGIEESEFESKIRKRIMTFMNVSESDYAMAFVPNQASAFKIVAESYTFQSNRRPSLLTVYDHTNEAIESMVDCSKKRGAHVRSVEFLFPGMRLRLDKLKKTLLGNRGLFVFPLQSRLTGSHYSYLWMGLARENKWHVLLDASALGPKEMDTLGLSLFKPDFLVCSFYKVFGDNPSGFGCLFVKRSSVESAFRGCSSAKTIGIVSLRPGNNLDRELGSGMPELNSDLRSSRVESEIEEIDVPVRQSERRVPENVPLESEEMELKGLDHADEIGIVLVKRRMRYLTNWLVNALMSLRHPGSDNKLSLVRIYGPKVRFERGPGIAFNVFDWKGEKIDPTLVQKLGDRHGVSLSVGTLDNIWFYSKKHEEHERLVEMGTNEHVIRKESRKKSKKEEMEFERGLKVVSASIGFLTNFEDMYGVWEFVSRFLDADFVEKERWRYLALNLETVEV